VYVATRRRTRIFMSYPRLSGSDDIIVPKLNSEIPYHRSLAWRCVASSSPGGTKMRTSLDIVGGNVRVEFVHYRSEALSSGAQISARRRLLTFDRRIGEAHALIEITLTAACQHLICGVGASQSRAMDALLPRGNSDPTEIRPAGR
jgi:hypothetical protein